MAGNGLAYESKDKIRDVLASILNAAVSYGYLLKNPADKVRVPPDQKGRRQNSYVTPQKIPEPYATMVFVAVYTGLRVSKLVGLRWDDIHEDSITIDKRYCRGNWGAPKSDASCATIGVNRCVIDRIRRMKNLVVDVRAGRAGRKCKVVKSDGPNDLVFQSVRNGRPMRDDNILARFIEPAARKLGLEFVNWRCLRTSHATWLKMAGADVKDAQAQMRHSRATTTLDIYQQFVPEGQKRVVARLSSLVN
jgi:integrase